MASFIVFDISGFSLNWFITLFAFDKKGNAVPLQTGVRFFWLGENKLHHCKACVYSEMICFFDHLRLLVCSSFDSGPCMGYLIRIRVDVLLFHNWENNNIICKIH